ncbi:MAG: carnitine dehydratase [Proteobacteria bacterium]|nr:MAG: carnitine dehydratase [Pseudomonadota bacterium]
MSRPGALDGTTVIDLSTVGPAPRATRILADYGARVIKISAPKPGVQIEPAKWAYGGGRGWTPKKIDLKSEEGRELFFGLVKGSDVVVESFRPGVIDRLGIGFEAARAVNPKIIYCSTSGYGQNGPAAKWAGHDLNYLAMGGYLAMSGRRADGGPALPGATVADAAAGGMHAALAVMAALLRRERTGAGEHLDVSVAEGVLSLMALAIEEHLATGAEKAPGGDLLTGRYACYDVYRARDGKWIAVGAIEPQFWANLCEQLGCERWIAHQTDDAVQAEVRKDLAAAFATRDRDDWVAQLAPADTCVAPVYEIAELVRDPHFAARGAFANGRVAPVLAGQRGAEER